MKAEAAVLQKLDLSAAATRVTTEALDRLPILISERALRGNPGRLVRAIDAEFRSGTLVSSTTFSMPRRGFGPRPVTVLSARDRALYDALVDNLRPSLPRESRTRENWNAFRRFGLPDSYSPARYVVTLDIAAMYEYVDHELLQQELVIQTMDASVVETLGDLLGEAFGFSRGLPQMMSSSDLLADVYIGKLERELLRHGYDVMRYADDFRIPANDWGTANRIIELAAEAARSIGLVLSSEKTTIQLAATLVEEEGVLQSIFEKYFDVAVAELTTFEDVMDWYGEVSTVEIEPSEWDAFHEAFLRVLSDWKEDQKASVIPQQLIAKSIRGLGKAARRIADDILTEMVFQAPIRLTSVVAYLGERAGEAEANRRSLSKLVAMERQSPWAKIWLLQAAGVLSADEGDEETRAILDWAEHQLRDDHEIVRAEAAWVLAGWKRLDLAQVSTLFASASRITRTGVAAASGRSGTASGDKVSRSIIAASPLYKDAYDWGLEFDATRAK